MKERENEVLIEDGFIKSAFQEPSTLGGKPQKPYYENFKMRGLVKEARKAIVKKLTR